jgi:hypothetical protein
MAGRIEWHNEEKTILLHIYEGDLIIDDYYHVIDESNKVISSQPHTVHTVLINQDLTSRPPSLASTMRYANRNMPPNQGIQFILKPPLFTRVMVNLARTLAPRMVDKVCFVDSLKEAENIVFNQDKRGKEGQSD